MVPPTSFPSAPADHDLQSYLAYHPWQKGFLDVTKPPFNAPNDGVTDATLQIQAAIECAWSSNLIVYFPSGTYLVDGTLNCIQEDGRNIPSTPPSAYVLPGSAGQRKYAHLLVGSTTGENRPTIKLADGASLTNNRLFNFIWADSVNGGNGTKFDDPARMYCALFRGIDIDMGNNPNATALYMNGAQLCSIEDVKISGAAFKVGLENVPNNVSV